MASVELRPARAGDLAAIQALLADCGLPCGDLDAHKLPGFLLAEVQHELVGSAGLEFAGSSALLRSVAVRADRRGTGLGRRLVEACLRLARDRQVREIFLIPDTAAAQSFFASQGCSAIDRALVPAEIRALSEFTSVCPQTRPCLHLKLAPNSEPAQPREQTS